jgi:hypothetical protein
MKKLGEYKNRPIVSGDNKRYPHELTEKQLVELLGGSNTNKYYFNSSDTFLNVEEASLWYQIYYFDSLQDAVDNVNLYTEKKSSSIGACYYKKNTSYVTLFKNLTIFDTININSKGLHINLNGFSINSTCNNIFSCSSGYLSILGSGKETIQSSLFLYAGEGSNVKLEGFKIISNLKDTTYNSIYNVINFLGDNINVNNIDIKVTDFGEGTINGINIGETSTCKINESTITVFAKNGYMSSAVLTYGNLEAYHTSFVVYSDHTANAAGNNYKATGRGLTTEPTSSTTLTDCCAIGAHSGMTAKGLITIDGGIYKGVSHGGLYLSASGANQYIKNATCMEEPMFEDYYMDSVAGTNGASFYSSGSQNIYIDNCSFTSRVQHIVLKSNKTEKLYISNSAMTTDYSRAGIRNDGSNYVYFGVGNTFNFSVLENKRNYTSTEDDYS